MSPQLSETPVITRGKFEGAALYDLPNDDLKWIYRQGDCPDRELIRAEQQRRFAIRQRRIHALRAA